LTTGFEDERSPNVSSDGGRVLFQAKKNRQWEIFSCDADTGRNLVQIVSHPSSDESGAWHPDGKSVVFVSNRLRNTWGLWRQSATGTGGATVIDRGSAEKTVNSPRVSPDGKRIVYVIYSDVMGIDPTTLQGATERIGVLWLVNLDGANATELAPGIHPTWSPDGTRIAFASKATGNWDVWVMNTDGSNVTQLTTDPQSQAGPSFSPDGSWIAYHSTENKSWDLWMVRVDGSGTTRLTNDPAVEQFPSWGVTGDIYFESDKSGNWDIWKLSPILPE